jgi:branched-chain amino acid transport system substrate-binding protein
MKSSTIFPIKVGVITDMTGPLSLLGIANANIAKMVIHDINDKGGLLGRQLSLHLEDSATNDREAEAKARKLMQEDTVDVILGGIYSSTRDGAGPASRAHEYVHCQGEQRQIRDREAPRSHCTQGVHARHPLNVEV